MLNYLLFFSLYFIFLYVKRIVIKISCIYRKKLSSKDGVKGKKSPVSGWKAFFSKPRSGSIKKPRKQSDQGIPGAYILLSAQHFYLSTHWTHFIYGYMVKDHSDSERGNPLLPHGYSFWLAARFFYMHHPTDMIAHTTAFVTPIMKHWLEQEIGQIGPPWRVDLMTHRTMSERSYHGATLLSANKNT